MSRKPNELIPKEAAAMEAVKISREEADRLWGDGLPFDQVRLETRIATNNSTVVERMAESGKDYLWAKAYLNHGEFMAMVDRTAPSHTYVLNCMRFADYFSNSASGPNLGLKKTRALTLFDKPIVEEYLKGGPLGDIPHDDVAKMTVGELEKEVRRLRKKLDDAEKDKRQIITQKNEKLNELETKLSGQEPPTAEQKAKIELQSLSRDFFSSLMCLAGDIRQALNVLARAEGIKDVTYPLLREWINQYTDDYEAINAGFTELQEAVKQPCIDSGEAEDE